MGRRDYVMKEYFKDEGRVASVLNYFVGEQIFSEADISCMDGFSSTRNSDGGYSFRQRDKLWKVRKGASEFYLGIENQAQCNLTFPTRVLEMDALEYRHGIELVQHKNQTGKVQYKEGDDALYHFRRNDRISAVVTLVLYWGNSPWNFPKSLKDIVNTEGLPSKIAAAAQDYDLNLIHMRSIPDEVLKGMNSDLKYVIGMIKQDRSRECYRRFIQENRDYFSRIPRSAFDLIDACINLNYIGGLIEAVAVDDNGEERLDMCKALEDMWIEAEKQGKRIGEEKGIAIGEKKGIMDTLTSLVNDGILSITDAAARAGVSVEVFQQHMPG